MNIHNKLKKLRFKKCGFYRPEYDKKLGWRMIPDNEIIRKNWANKIISIDKVLHAKNDSMYKLKYDKFKIWVSIKSNELFKIIIEDETMDFKSNNRIKEIFNSNKNKVESKIDIINLFPISIKRDIILSELFG